MKKAEKQQLLDLLIDNKHMSQGRQDRLPGKPVHINHRAEAKPFHGRAFSVPKACEKIAPPRTVKQVRSSHLVTPLTELTKKTNKSFRWQTKHQEAFNNLQRELARQVILAYPDFTKTFEIYTDASKYQIGAVITQENKPIAFYSRKLTDWQARYTITELELPALVEMLREYRSILLGQKIVVYTDHKNLTFANFTTDRVTRWRLIVEEHGPKIAYLPGKTNIIADALSRLPMIENTPSDQIFFTDTCFNQEDTDFPVSYQLISEKQAQDHRLQAKKNSMPKSPTNSEPTKFNALTIIDLATCLMELVAIPNKDTLTVAHALDHAWFSHYPRPVECAHDNGSEFVGIEFQEMLQSYGVKLKLTTVRNPQANGILECTHQVIGNLLRSTRLMSQDLSTLNAQQELLAPVTWAINSTYFKQHLDNSHFSVTRSCRLLTLQTGPQFNTDAKNSPSTAPPRRTAVKSDMNIGSTTGFLSAVALRTRLHIYARSRARQKDPTKSSTSNSSLSMVQSSSSAQPILPNASIYTGWCLSSNRPIEDANAVLVSDFTDFDCEMLTSHLRATSSLRS